MKRIDLQTLSPEAKKSVSKTYREIQMLRSLQNKMNLEL